MRRTLWIVALVVLLGAGRSAGEAWPPRAEGEGPFPRLILRGATLLDGTGAPPAGPVDIVIQNDRIAEVVPVGSPGSPIDPEGRPKADGGKEIDLSGMWVLPGFVDLYAHPIAPVEYVAKLWLGHGITTI